MMTIRRAVPGDLRTVTAILRSVAGWLHRQGYDQWPDDSPSFTPMRIGGQIDRGEFWVVSEDRDPIAVIALSRFADADFWTFAEAEQPAVYVSKAAVLRKAAGRGLGAMMLRWAVDRAAGYGVGVVRLDVWRTNAELQDYYRRQGWTYLRTEETAGRNSGALFCRRAAIDPEAREAFALIETPGGGVAGPIAAGMPVLVPTDDGPVSAVCTRVTSDMSYGEVGGGWEFGSGSAPPLYAVERDGASWLAREAWPDPAPLGATALEEVARH